MIKIRQRNSSENETKEYNDILSQEENQIANIEYQIRQSENLIIEKVMKVKHCRSFADVVDLSSYPYSIRFIPSIKKKLFEELKTFDKSYCNQYMVTPELIIGKVVIYSAFEVKPQENVKYHREVEYEATFFFIDGSKKEGVHSICPFYSIYNHSEEHKMIMANGAPIRITLL